LSKIDTTLAFEKNGTAELVVVAGSVRVTTWDRSAIRVHVTTTGTARFDLDASRARVTVDGARAESGTVICEMTVPAAARVRVNSTAAPVTMTGVTGLADLQTVTGAIDVTGTPQRIEIETVSGKVRVAGGPGDVHVSSVSGNMDVEAATGAVNLESVSGSIRVLNARTARLNVTTVSGAVTYDGNLDPHGRYDIESHSGAVTLALPDKTAASIGVETFSGQVRASHPGAVRRAEASATEHTSYRYVVGGGDAKVNVDTFSGRVEITAR